MSKLYESWGGGYNQMLRGGGKNAKMLNLHQKHLKQKNYTELGGVSFFN